MNNTLFTILVMIISMLQIKAFAFSWSDLWLRPDQQAKHALMRGKAKKAEQLFKNKNWRAVAAYRAGDFKKMVELLEETKTPLALYNRGNALARLGAYEAAIQSYDKVLALDPKYPDAKFNRDLLKKLLKNKKQKNRQNPQSKQSKNKKDQKQKQQAKNENKKRNNQKNQKKSQANASDKDEKKRQQAKNEQPKQSEGQSKRRKQNTKNQMAQRPTMAPEVKQWQAKQTLKQIPDDPGGLLRQKFLRDHERRMYEES